MNFHGTSPSDDATTSGAKKRRGAQPGNRQAFKNGRFTAERRARRAEISAMVRKANEVIAQAELELAWRKLHAPRGPNKRVLKP